ncbi:MAG: hypothetical protein JWL84_6205 [Rhodospirillales bacterium]|nr:hypothetical protein [Rhodospirillales bacterium]
MPDDPTIMAATTVALRLNGAALVADPSGALFWPEQRTLIVADLHLEKGSSFARHGALLPPYDTAASLAMLADALRRHGAQRIICLGDSFHDASAHERLGSAETTLLASLVAAHDWIWIAGNHDPAPPVGLGGMVTDALTLGPLLFRHVAVDGAAAGELSGHFHPTATVALRAGRLVARCFVADARRIILPAFGTFTGGLDVFEPAIARLFPNGFRIHVLGRGRVVSMPPERVVPTSTRGTSRTADRPIRLGQIRPAPRAPRRG